MSLCLPAYLCYLLEQQWWELCFPRCPASWHPDVDTETALWRRPRNPDRMQPTALSEMTSYRRGDREGRVKRPGKWKEAYGWNQQKCSAGKEKKLAKRDEVKKKKAVKCWHSENSKKKNAIAAVEVYETRGWFMHLWKWILLNKYHNSLSTENSTVKNWIVYILYNTTLFNGYVAVP